MRVLLLSLLLIPILSIAQHKPKSKDNVIVVYGKTTLNNLARFLVVEGYEIETNDSDLNYLTTGFKDVSKANNSSFKIKAVIKDNQVDITGEIRDLIDIKRQTYKQEPVYVTPLSTPRKAAFNKMLTLATKYAEKINGTVTTVYKK